MHVCLCIVGVLKDAMEPDLDEGETAERMEKVQTEIREAKQRAKDAKAQQEGIKMQQQKVACTVACTVKF